MKKLLFIFQLLSFSALLNAQSIIPVRFNNQTNVLVDPTAALFRSANGIQALDADLTDLADGSLTGSKVGSGINAANITTGIFPDLPISPSGRLHWGTAAYIQDLTGTGFLNIVSLSNLGINASDNLVIGGSNITVSGNLSVPAGSIDLSEMANMATSKLLGRYTTGSGSPQELSISSDFTVTGGTLALASGSGVSLSANNTWTGTNTFGNVTGTAGGTWDLENVATIKLGKISGQLVLNENASVALDPAGSADGKFSGTTVTGIGGTTIAFGDLITLDKDDSRWELVDISVAAAATGDARGIMGMAVSSSADGSPVSILLNGIIRADANFPPLTIGAATFASTGGNITVTPPATADDVIRIVGHALTADEMMFNPDGHWESVEAGGFTYYSTVFDGTTDYLLSTATPPTGLVDGNKGLVSFWIKLGADAGSRILQSSTFTVLYEAGGRIRVQAQDSTPADVLYIHSPYLELEIADGWTHVIASWDLSVAGRRYIYINDVDVTNQAVFTVGGTINYDASEPIAIGGTTLGSELLNASLCEFYFTTPAAFFDISDSANRLKFRTAGNKPEDLGVDGSTPTGTQPLIYFRNQVPNWDVNLGSGGTFTENGTLVDGAADKP